MSAESELAASERYYWSKIRGAYDAKDVMEIVGWFSTAVRDDPRLHQPLTERLRRMVEERDPESINRYAGLKAEEVGKHV